MSTIVVGKATAFALSARLYYAFFISVLDFEARLYNYATDLMIRCFLLRETIV